MGFRARPKIIVIDDSQIVLAVTKQALEKAGYQVLTRDRATGCVALILQEAPDLVLVDVSMPGVAGDTLVKLFSSASPDSRTIVLLHSSLDEHALQTRAAAAQADGYIKKTDDERKLVRAIDGYLRPASPRRSATRSRFQSDPLASSGTSSSSISNSSLQQVGGSLAMPPLGRSGERPASLPTVLFVDDDMLTLSGYRRQLQSEAIRCDFALSGTQAIRHLTSERPPQVVVCDLLMPSPSGLEVYEAALKMDRSWGRRFVFVTGAPSDAKKDLSGRFYGVLLTKPVDTEDLRQAIDSCLFEAGVALSQSSAR